ncbi:Uncharacterized protein FWK35_00019285 [Aphis craccivora]|uniref:Uncharacterized protein n=1 Tax=Aphis craccivora TaxID=307492 RepID=A0A6G0YFT7_APHCR|nr:Uncharacterized protein FWK35_00019285 [Aphis craccivora]
MGLGKKSNIKKIHIFKNKTLSRIKNTPFHVSNQTLYTDMKIQSVIETTSKSYKRYQNSLSNHPNLLEKNLFNPMPGNPLND